MPKCSECGATGVKLFRYAFSKDICMPCYDKLCHKRFFNSAMKIIPTIKAQNDLESYWWACESRFAIKMKGYDQESYKTLLNAFKKQKEAINETLA